jgi:cobalt-zinc-cadmium efflux system protein
MAASHDHDHAPAAADLTPAFKWAVGLNATYVLIEAVAGFWAGSLALLADAAHNLTDVGGLLIAWGAAVAAARPPSVRYTFGFGRATQLAALVNALSILIGVGVVLWEAGHRFFNPSPVPGGVILVVALVGIGINAGTALLFRDSRHHDLNAKGAFLHMAADAAVSLAVVLAAIGILWTGWNWLDPAVAILVSVLIAWTAYGLLRSAMAQSLDRVPDGIDHIAVRHWLAGRPGVGEVHDLHIWPISTTRIALSAHLVMPGGHPGDRFLEAVQDELEDDFGIGHATLQIELGDGEPCRLAPAQVI